MTNIYQTAAEFVATQKLTLAASNLQHLLKLQAEQTSLDAIVQSLQQTLIDAHAGNDDDFTDILAAQARILDATFHYYINNSRGTYSEDDKINIALRAQRQTDRAINSWKRLKQQKPRTIRHVIVKDPDASS